MGDAMGKLKGLLTLAIVAGAIYVGWNMIPPYFHNYTLQDDLDDIARRNTYTQTNEEGVKQIVITKARQSDITLKEDQITVTPWTRRPGHHCALSACILIWWCARLIWTLPPIPLTNGYKRI